MSSSSNRDLSLYELALKSHPALTPLQVSPATFKAVVDATIDTLVERQVQATLWVKLPTADEWQATIKRYSRSATAGPVYVLSYQKDKEDVSEELAGEIALEVIDSAAVTEAATYGAAKQITDTQDAIVAVPLTLDGQLRREYFLLVISEQFCSLIVAHRPRSIQVSRSEAATHSSSGGNSASHSHTLPGDGDTVERKQPLLALYSMHEPVLGQVLQELQKLILANTSTSYSDAIDWAKLNEVCQTYHANPQLLSTLLSKQMLRQEDVWHRASTYRRQAEATEALQLQNEELLNAIRLKDEFLSNVGQELRTPLTNMKTALTLLNSPQLKTAQRQRYMQLLSTECDRQSSLISSLQDLVQLAYAGDNTPMQALYLTDVLPGVVSTYQPLAQEKGVMLAYTIPEDLPPVSCLNAWLKQIAINLIHNGIKFTATGGQVWVKAKQMGDYVQVEFRDTGIGIPAPEIPKIFDRFYRVRHAEDYGGAGLGLTIVQQILLRCGGSISVKSKPGEGSTFNVLLPIYRTTPEA